jgi:hypothetical protein
LISWRLRPPLAPLRLGSYGFGRDIFKASVPAGFVTGAIKTVEQPPVGTRPTPIVIKCPLQEGR